MADDLHPQLPGEPTKGKPRIVDGVTWVSRRTGVMNYPLFSTDGRARVSMNFSKATYTASVDGKAIGYRFRERHTAMRAAAKAMRKEPSRNGADVNRKVSRHG